MFLNFLMSNLSVFDEVDIIIIIILSPGVCSVLSECRNISFLLNKVYSSHTHTLLNLHFYTHKCYDNAKINYAKLWLPPNWAACINHNMNSLFLSLFHFLKELTRFFVVISNDDEIVSQSSHVCLFFLPSPPAQFSIFLSSKAQPCLTPTPRVRRRKGSRAPLYGRGRALEDFSLGCCCLLLTVIQEHIMVLRILKLNTFVFGREREYTVKRLNPE